MKNKNFRKLPKRILEKVQRLNDDIIVSCLIKFSHKELSDGELSHLGISLDATGLHFPDKKVPLGNRGKYSRRNINGVTLVRKDLPKQTVYTARTVPNWGDYSKGDHTVHIPHEQYQRNFISPAGVGISISCYNSAPDLENYAILFELDEVLNKSSSNFDQRLLELINIMQENLAACDVNNSSATFTDYISTIQLAWEILPLGDRAQVVQRLTQGTSVNPTMNQIINSRCDFLDSLNPASIIVGTSGLHRYLGAKISENLIVFENLLYGNAIYVMHEDWEALSQRSRTDLLSGKFGTNFERVVHTAGWENRVRGIIKKHLGTP